ncbi:Hypp8 [Branchiostoma lanceolatum]|uniref:Hypp8 protein n=1 Tax=Branchiostoma lanceolatum TaxID=7740 RepID=A0A8J9WB86_BRALA|nr:Hypp8 [Branchiostoma lanceolatum]
MRARDPGRPVFARMGGAGIRQLLQPACPVAPSRHTSITPPHHQPAGAEPAPRQVPGVGPAGGISMLEASGIRTGYITNSSSGSLFQRYSHPASIRSVFCSPPLSVEVCVPSQ